MNIELPKDAEGREIPLDVDALYDKSGQEIEVSRWQYYPRVGSGYWNLKSARNKYYRQDEVYLAPPDSWEKLEEDLDSCSASTQYAPCTYFSNSTGNCEKCPAYTNRECLVQMVKYIALRIHKLRGKGDAD